jgi:hypothetical protein
MKNNQLIVIDWLVNTGNNFITDIIELDGNYEGIPIGILNAFNDLTDDEKLEVITTAGKELIEN